MLFVELLSNVFLYFLIGVELFINMPINGVYRVPISFLQTKDNTIIAGMIASIAFASFMAVRYPLSLPIIAILGVMYFIYLKCILKPFTPVIQPTPSQHVI